MTVHFCLDLSRPKEAGTISARGLRSILLLSRVDLNHIVVRISE